MGPQEIWITSSSSHNASVMNKVDRVGLIDRIKVKINGAVSVVQAIALLSIHPRAGTTLPDPEYIAVGQARSVLCVSVPSRPPFGPPVLDLVD